MKTVFNNTDLCHTYAQQTQTEGRTANRSIFFYNGKIFSYGHHFCMANIVEGVMYFTLRNYSNSTSKHINILRNATSHYTKVFCAFPDGSPTENFKYWYNEATNAAEKLKKAKKPEIYLNALQHLANEIQIYADALNIAIMPELIALIAIKDKTEYISLLEKRKAEKELKEAKEAREAKIKFKEAYKKWANNESQYIESRINLDFLRIKNADRIETTQAVEIPQKMAIALYQSIKNNTLKIGDKILNFTVNNINTHEISIGCHKFKKAYLLNFGAKLATI